jgi:hypothetical protein
MKMGLDAIDNAIDQMFANSEQTTGLEALNSFLTDLRNDAFAVPSAATTLAKFIARCAQGTGLTIKVDDPCADRIQTVSGGFDLLVWDGDYLVDPVHKNPMSGCALFDLRYSARSGKLTLDLDEGETITITITGLADVKPKPIKIPAPKSDVAGIAALQANMKELEEASFENRRQRHRDTEDMIAVANAADDMSALFAFIKNMTTAHVAVNDQGPIDFDAAVQWHKDRLYVLGKCLWPEVGNITFCPVQNILSIYEQDRDRQTTIQIVAAPEVLPLAA